MKRYIVAIDGPAGAGKSTVSKLVAQKLGYLYIDTGAMYRAIALKAIRMNLSFYENDKLIKMAEGTDITLKTSDKKGSLLDIFMDDGDVTEEIRTQEVSQGASKVSSIPEIRKILQQKQRRIGKDGGIVMEGRDIGTVVFPNAEFKFYMDATVEERAMRRYRELRAKGQEVSLGVIEKEIAERDDRDKNRKADPLVKSPDAIYIDSTGMSIEESADIVVEYINKHG
ncbi:MAG: (d)CMP kinase [Elusimicrobia bacterium]|nr:(d)CMP kinase [Candidatus Liberimonas magnetica]